MTAERQRAIVARHLERWKSWRFMVHLFGRTTALSIYQGWGPTLRSLPGAPTVKGAG